MKYIGVTIGPIYKTMARAKKTREIWAASYMFSYILRKLANEFDREFVLPKKDNSVKEIGVFNDRFIFKSNDGDYEKLPEKIDKVLKDFAKNNNIDYEFLKEYLQIHYVEVEVENLQKENIVEKVYKYLDSSELFFNTTQKESLNKFFENISKSEMMEFAFGKDKRFPTIFDISMADLIEKRIFSKDELKILRGFEDKKEDNLESILEKKKIPNYYKYIAVVKADGDNMGKVNKLLQTKEDYVKLSCDLFDFIKEANDKIDKFGGKVILGSGDDLLFMAPVKYKGNNIFDLILDLKKCYETKMEKWNKKLTDKTTLSIGLNISYYKYPLFEMFKMAQDMLYMAKEPKDSIAFNIVKHSGQNFWGVVPKSIKDEVKSFLNNDFKFYSSIIYKINENKDMINYLGEHNRDFYPFFKNNFNENFNEDIFKKISLFLHTLYKDSIINSDKFKKLGIDKMFLFYSILKFSHFIRDKNEKAS